MRGSHQTHYERDDGKCQTGQRRRTRVGGVSGAKHGRCMCVCVCVCVTKGFETKTQYYKIMYRCVTELLLLPGVILGCRYQR